MLRSCGSSAPGTQIAKRGGQRKPHGHESAGSAPSTRSPTRHPATAPQRGGSAAAAATPATRRAWPRNAPSTSGAARSRRRCRPTGQQHCMRADRHYRLRPRPLPPVRGLPGPRRILRSPSTTGTPQQRRHFCLGGPWARSGTSAGSGRHARQCCRTGPEKPNRPLAPPKRARGQESCDGQDPMVVSSGSSVPSPL